MPGGYCRLRGTRGPSDPGSAVCGRASPGRHRLPRPGEPRGALGCLSPGGVSSRGGASACGRWRRSLLLPGNAASREVGAGGRLAAFPGERLSFSRWPVSRGGYRLERSGSRQSQAFRQARAHHPLAWRRWGGTTSYPVPVPEAVSGAPLPPDEGAWRMERRRHRAFRSCCRGPR